MQIKVKKSQLKGVVSIPASKSHTMRAILFASLAEGVSHVYNYLKSPDTDAMIKACQLLGATITVKEGELIIKGFAGKPKKPKEVIDSGNSGQVLRFIGALCGLIDGPSVITGDESIRTRRPVLPLLEGLSQIGAKVQSADGKGYAPITVQGPVFSGNICVDGQDSQPISGLLILASQLFGKTVLQVRNPGEKPWILLTLSWFDQLQIPYQNQNFERYEVTGPHLIRGFSYSVPGDLSTLSFPLVAALITQSEITIENVDLLDIQGDKKILSIVESMGAKLKVDSEKKTIKVLPSGKLQGISVDINDLVDALPVLSVLGCFTTSDLHLKNASVARKKESDRLSAMRQELTKMGGEIEEFEEGMIIHPAKLRPAVLSSHKDHRIAMSLCLAGFCTDGETIVEDVDCIRKSYPGFVEDMKMLGANIELL